MIILNPLCTPSISHMPCTDIDRRQLRRMVSISKLTLLQEEERNGYLLNSSPEKKSQKSRNHFFAAHDLLTSKVGILLEVNSSAGHPWLVVPRSTTSPAMTRVCSNKHVSSSIVALESNLEPLRSTLRDPTNRGFRSNFPLVLMCATSDASSTATRSPSVKRSGSVNMSEGAPPAKSAQSLPILAPRARKYRTSQWVPVSIPRIPLPP